MSLINDALKRAARQRQSDQAGYAPPVPGQTGGGHAVAHRGKPLGSQALILIVAGAAALIVVSVVVTVYLLREEPAPRPAPAPPVAAKIPAAAPTPAETPPVVLSIPAKPPTATEAPPAQAAATTPAAAVVPEQAPPTAAPAATLPASATVPATAARPAPPTPAAPNPAPGPTTAKAEPAALAPAVTPDQQVLVYLDNLRILGVRFAGIDSKVLIGDRVFRVNDVIERNFGLKLVEVQPNRLYFVDARGVTYAKNL